MVLLVLGSFLVILGISNLRGNISSVHWYNRRKVTAEDAPKYGKLVGAGTIVSGCSLILPALLEALCKEPLFLLLIPVGIPAGLSLILYA